jgi:hypothetical protein
MPSLSFFIDELDSSLLLERLNADPEIAFIIPDGWARPQSGNADQSTNSPRPAFDVCVGVGEVNLELERPEDSRWKAVQIVDALSDGLNSLWHIPAGPLPLIKMDSALVPLPLQYPPIPDPWAGWTGPPGFGTGCHSWIRLALWTRHRPYTEQERASLRELNAFWLDKEDMLVVSDFQWTGNHFRPAPPQTHRWWNRMKRWVDGNAVQLPTKAGFSFWAFPSALQKLKDGMRYYARNFDLDDAIHHVKNSQGT